MSSGDVADGSGSLVDLVVTATDPKARAQRAVYMRWPEFPPPPPVLEVLYGIFWGLPSLNAFIPAPEICHTGPIIVGVGGEILVVIG